MAVQKGRKVCRSGREVLDMESNVFDEAGGPFLSKAAYRREDAGADGPVLCHLLGVCREAYLYAEGLQRGGNGLNLLLEDFRRSGLGFGKDGRQIRNIGLQMRVIHGSEAALVQKFGGRYLVGLHSHHGLGGRHDVREIDHGAGLVRSNGQRFHRYLRQEGQRSLRSYQQVGQYFKGVLVGHQGP